MAVRARATATASRLTPGRSSSRITTRATSAGRSSSAIRPLLAGQRLRQGRRHEVRPRRARAAGRSHLLCALRSSAHCCLHQAARPRPVYRCDRPNLQLGQRRCFSFGGKRIDETIAAEMLRAVAPMAIEAAMEAERMLRVEDQDRRRIAEMELQQAQYDASLAERRYAACDPDNRLIAAQLEKAWEAALQRVEVCQTTARRLAARPMPATSVPTSQGWPMICRRHGRHRAPRCERASDWCAR